MVIEIPRSPASLTSRIFSLRVEDVSWAEEESEPQVMSLDSALSLNQCTQMGEDLLSHLRYVITESRLDRLMQSKELALSFAELQCQRPHLAPKALEKLLLGLGDVRFIDLQEAAQRREWDLSCLTLTQLDELYGSLIPSNALQKLFSESAPAISYYDKVITSGKGYKGLRERVSIIFALWQGNTQGDKQELDQLLKEGEILTSRLGDREPPLGTIIRLHHGYFVVDQVFAGGGAYISVLRDLTNKESPLLVCRGTAVRMGATSGLLSGINDIQIEIGMLGIQTVWPQVANYLREQRVETIHILGKSLGGAHAQYLATLITGLTSTRVKQLETYCSVGNPEITCEILQQALTETGKAEPTIWVVRNGGQEHKAEVDYIPTLGGPHLSTASENTHVYYLVPRSQETGTVSDLSAQYALRPLQYSWLKKVFKLLISFPIAHMRQTTLRDFVYYESHRVQEEVRNGSELEWLRKWPAKLFNCLTLGRLNTPKFSAFYHSLKTSRPH